MPVIVLDSLYKTYKPGLLKKKVSAVNGLSLSVPEGTVYGLVGPNGAGKSTTIRMLLGLVRPDRGRIEINSFPVGDARSLQGVGYLPENPYLYDHLSLFELLQFSGKACGLPSHVIADRIAMLTADLGIDHALKRRLRTFSKGMRQRAGLGFALLHDPDLVVLDEPMSGLDPLGRRMVCNIILDLKRKGKTVFFCSHILNDVERLCDQVAILHKGQLVQHFGLQDINAFRSGARCLEDEFVTIVGES